VQPSPPTSDVERVRRVADADPQAMFATARRDGTIQASLIRAGVMDHPVTGRPTVAALLRGWSVKLRHLRRIPRATVLFRSPSAWVTVEGRTSLIGPEDGGEGYDPATFPALRRTVYTAAGGTPTEEWDRLMDDERRALVFVELDRVYSNTPRPGS
jgi:PPOX class probable F420-dependent enzyme